jgi:uncharacterized coiled-coil DUF342 family protein
MPYTTHGHWYGTGEPTTPWPRLRAKCFGLGGCPVCRTEAGLPELPELPPKWSETKTSVPAAPMSTERLAEILWTSRALALGDDPADHPFADVSARLRTQYTREAEEVAKLLDQDRADPAPADLRIAYADAIAAWQMRHAVVCEHTQVISYGEAANAVLAVRDGEMDQLRAELDEARNQTVTAGTERDEARAEVERLRAELAEAERLRDKYHAALKVANGNTERRDAKLKEAEAERDAARDALATVRRNWQHLSDRVVQLKKENAGRKAHGEQLRDRLASAEGGERSADSEVERLHAELDQTRNTMRAYATEAADLEGLAVDLGVKLKETEAERDKARAEVTFLTEVMAGTALLGADDAIGMVRALTQHLAEADVIGADQAERVNAGLDKQQGERDRLAEQIRALTERLNKDIASAQQEREETIATLIERDGVWSGTHPSIARLDTEISTRQAVAKRLRALDGQEATSRG